MRKMAFFGSVTYSGANLCKPEFSADSSSSIGALQCCSYKCLRGWNHSRRLLRFKLLRNFAASGGKPLNVEANADSPFAPGAYVSMKFQNARSAGNDRLPIEPSQCSDLARRFAEPTHAVWNRRTCRCAG